ncbi:DUF5064 family protein [Pseudomonas sp. KNUC1026]|uniref:DUF5064 family protein n=1 Tax=Pseudomonas sp. KNUC1026 TaxID=2893890 RepID=UPI001F16D9FB|nr:DUF5064 family protein [Pseudomonas sp. KNUC1026]UFH48749.1 DUF5064 family protein [Pseudomonas sp. KNUC1026]
MFKPGHLHLEHRPVQKHDAAYQLDVHYDLQTTDQGPGMHFRVTGDIAGKPVDTSFDLPRDMAVNFASHIDRIARQHGLPKTQVVPVSLHRQYDEMFNDIRTKLNLHSGDALSTERLDRL